ncbi:flagellar hook-associated protein FlgL [candidate division KSB1 bacterium]|nr:flagellar hook-associated protein FlgL [candidate division KSB1 bacterium]
MRVTRNMMLSSMMMNISDIQKKLFKNQMQISESRRILTPADDPSGTTHVLFNKTAMAKNEQYQTNVMRALNWMETTESVLDQLNTLFSDVDVIANRGATDIYGANERHTYAEDISDQLDNLLKFARTMYNGRYIFGGHETMSAPFEGSNVVENETVNVNVGAAQNLQHVHLEKESVIVRDTSGGTTYSEGTDYTIDYENGTITALASGNMVDGQNYVIDYKTEGISSVTTNSKGTSGDIKYQIGNDVTAAINIQGDELFTDQVDMFNLLIDLRNKLERDDIDGVQGLIGDIKTGIEHITKMSGEMGGRVSRLTMTSQFLENEHIQLEDIGSRENDLDVAAALVQMQALDLAYQTSLTANSEILQMSLVNLLNR